MRMFVLGGTGFVGRHVVRCLHTCGHEVVVFHRGSTSAELPPTVRTVLGDRQNLAAVAGEVERFGPNVVIDIIPYTEPQARDVMATFRGRAGRIVALSSGDVYRNYDGLRRVIATPADPCPLAEDAPLRENLYPYRSHASGPANPLFDYEKILVERVVLGDPELPGTILRLPMVYGPADPHHRLFPYLKRMNDRRPAILLAKGQAKWRWTRGYVENVAAAVAHAAAADRAVGQVYNVGEVSARTEAEWVTAIGRAGEWNGAVVALPATMLPAGLAPDFDWRYCLEMDTNRLRQQLGFVEQVAAEEALRRSVDWEQHHPPGEGTAGIFDYAAEDAALARAGFGPP